MGLSDQDAILENENRLKKIYYIAVKTRNFEIAQLVQRNNFFMIFQGVLLASIIYSSNTVPFIHFIISISGCYIAFQQTKAAAGAKFWQEYWETEVIKAEKELASFYQKKTINTLPFISMFDKKLIDIEDQVEQRLNKREPTKFSSSIFNLFSTKKLILEKPSVSKIPIRVGRYLTIIWAISALSSIAPLSHGLQWLTEKQFFQGFPNHKEAAKQEIYLSQDEEKIGALHITNDKKREKLNQLTNEIIPFKMHLDSTNNPINGQNKDNLSNEINLNISMNGKELRTLYETNDDIGKK